MVPGLSLVVSLVVVRVSLVVGIVSWVSYSPVVLRVVFKVTLADVDAGAFAVVLEGEAGDL